MNIQKVEDDESLIMRFLKKQYIKSLESGIYGPRRHKHISCFSTSAGKPLNSSNGRVLIGRNIPSKSHPLMQNFKRKRSFELHEDLNVDLLKLDLHAEIDIITKVIQSHRTMSFEGLTLWIARFRLCSSSGKVLCLPSFPCCGCLQKIKSFNIETIIHT